MNLHKDKERLRHRRQVKLLDEVMKIVPKPMNDSSSKIRKLRRLVLYYHFMQNVHTHITKASSNSKGPKNVEKKTPIKSAHKSIMVHSGTKKKTSRANIVFLKIDTSKSEEKNILDKPIIKENGDYSESLSVKNLEYKIPEIVMVNAIDDGVNLNSGLLVGNNVQVDSNHSNSPGEFSLQSDLASEDNYIVGKESHSYMSSNGQVNDQLNERASEHIIVNDNLNISKYQKTDFQNILQDYSNNSTLKDITVSNTMNENICVADVTYPEQNADYVLEVLPFENFSTYPVNLSSGNVILTDGNLNCKKPSYNFDSNMIESELHDNCTCSSSTITDNLHIDVENLSDSSNEMCKMKADNLANSISNSPKALVYEFPPGTVMNYNDYFLPFVPSNYSYLESCNEQNKFSSMPVGYLPYYDTVPPSTIGFSESPSMIQYFEPVHSIQERFVEPQFINDNVAFYSPSSFESFPSERSSVLHSKIETVKSESDSQENFFEENKPVLLEEVSFPLSQYINNY